jgi:uncharacterized membrane protein YkoI
MKKISWFWVTICSFLAISLVVSWLQFGKVTPTNDILTKQEAQKLVQDRYQGTVSQIKLAAQQYDIELKKQNNLYLIKMDAESGKVLSFIQTNTTIQKPDPIPNKELSVEEIKTIVLTNVNGSIKSIEKIENNQEPFYKVIVSEADNLTTITIDAISGEILASTTSTINETPKTLTVEEAGQIALKQIQGSIDDIWLETKNEQTYYLVEVETPEDREAIVQIHAITGEVLSITRDDHKEDDD